MGVLCTPVHASFCCLSSITDVVSVAICCRQGWIQKLLVGMMESGVEPPGIRGRLPRGDLGGKAPQKLNTLTTVNFAHERSEYVAKPVDLLHLQTPVGAASPHPSASVSPLAVVNK